ncbi:sigma-54-dependent Fis family transcriptional regulator [Paraburkholderia phytofirmans]|uniref:GAF modulated sigma54 specific transcriptional regulator, Fis family n=1 Tax=Paraburkholderia phytofirmans (strain DSM 17436 / LMG 22146 / PsJN) TaxID=398527 RepID=B2TFZ7_PARPJ|nr:sigma-54-dependent Fis family transcriptional regulator [Paraburkholderia phytofirmans]ACD20257.1 GAF modulated sigma54 specific transcriptional regulator, Fis family [Paraburkholderia phytofirmans PsJN]
MPYVSQTQHIDRVRGAIEGRLPAPADSPRLVSSWQRSFEQYRLDPGAVIGPRVLSSAELREVQGKEEAFLRASGQCLSRLHDMIRVADYCVMLTDAHGVTIDYRIDRDRRSDFKHAGLYIGSCWSEREEGTCGVANVLTDLAPIIVHKTDHFRAAFTTLTCSAAPIFAPTGEMIGVLDASAVQSPDNRDSQRLVFQLVRQSAGLIEDGYFLNQTSQHWVLFGHSSRNFVEAQPEVLIAFDECGNLVAANRKARECIPALNGPRHIDDVFDTSGSHLHDIARTDAIVGLRLRATGTTLYARIRAPLRRISRAASTLNEGAARSSQSASQNDLHLGALGRFLHSAEPRIAHNAAVALRVMGKRLPILILGETGVGKEVFAHAVHDSGARRARPFIAVNCGAIPESLIESELFGYAPGAFTGARSRGARGKIAQAHTGTLFLDEIGDMPLDLQTRLLRVLAEGEVTPLGADAPVRVDIDVICATHRDLTQMVAAGTFREDLYYRLSGASLPIPPLRERADIRDVIEAVFDEEAQMAGHVLTLDPQLAERLAGFAWPGNIRQLRNVLRYACAICDSARVELRHVAPDMAALLAPEAVHKPALLRIDPHDGRQRDALQAPRQDPREERARIIDALTRHQWRPNAAAQALGMSRATLYRRIASLGIVAPHRR